MAKVVWTEEAERWLRKIHDYIAVNQPVTAFKVVESIYRQAQILGQTHVDPPGRGLIQSCCLANAGVALRQ